MYYRVVIEGYSSSLETCGADFGRVLGRHTDYMAARKAASKGKSGVSIIQRVRQQVIELDTDVLLKTDENHREVFWPILRDMKFVSQSRQCAELIEGLRTGERSESLCKNMLFLNEFDEDMTFSTWMERFEPSALLIIEEREKILQDMAAAKAKQASIVQSFDKAASEITYSFPAVKGIQATKEFYIAQVPFKYLVKFFTFADENLSADLRAQRKVNLKHANDISDYVIENRESYVLPSLTVSVNAAMQFETVNISGLADRLGVLRIPVDATLLINDGQHRRMSAETFIQLDKTLGDETIPVVFYFDEGLAHSKQMFADLNANISKPSAAINALYNLRNPFNRFVIDALARHPSIDKLVDKEKTTIGAKSENLWSLVHWKNFAEKLLNVSEAAFADLDDESIEPLKQFFDVVVGNLRNTFRLLDLVMTGVMAAETLRAEHILGHAVFLESLGLALNPLLRCDQAEISRVMENLAAIALNKDAEQWNNRCIVAGRMIKNSDSVKLTAAYLREVMELSISESMIETCNRHGFTNQ